MTQTTLKDGLTAASRAMEACHSSETDQPTLFPIALNGSEEEQAHLKHIVNEMCRTPSGKKIIEATAKAGYRLLFDQDTIANDQYGYTNCEEKVCALNPENTIEESIVTMAHEMRHATQFEHPITDEINIFTYDTKSNLHFERIKEADAESYGCMVAWELKEIGRPQAWNDFCESAPEVAIPFERAVEEGRDESDARTQAFLGWYENRECVGDYDASHIEELESYPTNVLNKKLKSASAQKIINALCKDDQGNTYFTAEAHLLESGKYAAVDAETKKRFEAYFEERSQVKSCIPDMSLSQIGILPEKKAKEKGRAVSETAKEVLLSTKQRNAQEEIQERRRLAPKDISSAILKTSRAR